MSYRETNVLGGALATARRTVADFARLRTVVIRAKDDLHGSTSPLNEAPSLPSLDAACEQQAVNDAKPNVVAAEVEVKGSIASLTELHVYGAIEGSVRAPKVTICAGGIVRGEISAEYIVVYGRVEGRVLGGDVRLFGGSHVVGEIAHFTLALDVAADFEGSITRARRPAAPPTLMTLDVSLGDESESTRVLSG